MKKPIRILLVSDNHGTRDTLEYVRKAHADCDYFIHCGDAELPSYLVDGFAIVQGNNDNYNQFPSRLVLKIGTHTVLVVHGHRDMFFGHYDMLAAKAAAVGADVCFFGHTHIPFDQEIDGVRILNPGSIWHNRDGSKPSYMIVTFDGDEIAAEKRIYEKQG